MQLLEEIADDTEAEHQDDVEIGVRDRIGADDADDDDQGCDDGEGNAHQGGKHRNGEQHERNRNDVADIHRGDQPPDEILLIDEQHRPGVQSPDHQPAHHDGGRRGAGNAEREHRQ